jgi:hypothetical protein
MWLINQIAENQKTFGYKASIIYISTYLHTNRYQAIEKKNIFHHWKKEHKHSVFSNKRQCIKGERRRKNVKMNYKSKKIE